MRSSSEWLGCLGEETDNPEAAKRPCFDSPLFFCGFLSFPGPSVLPAGTCRAHPRSRVIQSVRGEGRGCQTSANAIESGRVQLGVGVAGVRSPVGHSMLILECAGTLVPVTVSVPPHCATDDAENTGTLGQNWSHLTDGRCHNDVIPYAWSAIRSFVLPVLAPGGGSVGEFGTRFDLRVSSRTFRWQMSGCDMSGKGPEKGPQVRMKNGKTLAC